MWRCRFSYARIPANLKPPVIYRDLKPSNVMLTPSGQVKLIDFGIARLFQPLSNATMIGTQGYAPPEQYRGKVEFRSDLYALGATMHHALSGRDPAFSRRSAFRRCIRFVPMSRPRCASWSIRRSSTMWFCAWPTLAEFKETAELRSSRARRSRCRSAVHPERRRHRGRSSSCRWAASNRESNMRRRQRC